MGGRGRSRGPSSSADICRFSIGIGGNSGNPPLPMAFLGLKSFREDYPEARPILLYRGTERLLRDGILVLPVEDFLRNLVPGRPPLDAF